MKIYKIYFDDSYKIFLKIYNLVYDAVIQEISINDREACIRAFSEKETCYLLYKNIIEKRPRTIIETGTFLGLSTLICAMALKQNFEENGELGKIYTISLDSFYRVDNPLSKALKISKYLNISNYIHFLEGSSVPVSFMETNDFKIANERENYLKNKIIAENRESLLHKLISIIGQVDFVYLDGLHYEAYQMTEISAVFGRLSKNGSIFIDDVLLTKRINDFKKIIKSLINFDFQLRKIYDYLRCNFRFYYLPWIVDSFYNTDIANLTIFRTNKNFLRAVEIQLNPKYLSHYGRLDTWFYKNSLKEFLDKYELK